MSTFCSRDHLYRVGVLDHLDSYRELCTLNPQAFYPETAETGLHQKTTLGK